MEKKCIYLALLRGINVGGNNIIKMSALKELFEHLGFTDVRTYIASGNVIFATEKTKISALESVLEKALHKEFAYKARVLVRSQKDILDTVANFPKIFQDSNWKHNVIFLGEEINNKMILKSLELKPGIEKVCYSKGVLYWSAQMKTITKSNMIKLSSKPQYQKMTVRSQNTILKLAKMIE